MTNNKLKKAIFEIILKTRLLPFGYLRLLALLTNRADSARAGVALALRISEIQIDIFSTKVDRVRKVRVVVLSSSPIHHSTRLQERE